VRKEEKHELPKIIAKMVGTARFTLDVPDQGENSQEALAAAGENASTGPGTQAQTSNIVGDVPPPPRLPYAPDPGMYTQLWFSESDCTSAVDMAAECETYLKAFTGTPVNYNRIVMSLLATADGMVFLTILTGNQVCPIHLLGRFSCGLGRPTQSHNRIFGLLGEKVGDGYGAHSRAGTMVSTEGKAPTYDGRSSIVGDFA
jgi:hypothetical protein